MSFPIQGQVHEYAPRRIAFEFTPINNTNILIFVGGLMDGLLTVPYLPLLANELGKIGWSLIQIEFSSSHIGWGTGSLSRDSTEISQLVKYLKSIGRVSIGIMGHSTGCQNTMHYFTKQSRDENYNELDFGIIQAPVSDRVFATTLISKQEIDESLALANGLINSGNQLEIMPQKFTKHFFNVPINAYRWKSLMGFRGDDDFFSSDLSDDDFKSTFGKFDKPLLTLYGGSDEYVPDWLNKKELMDRWGNNSKNFSSLSKIIDGGVHNLGEGSKEGASKEAVDTVIKFIDEIYK